MGPRRIGPLDKALEAWAVWSFGSGSTLGASGRTMLAKLIDGNGEILFHNKGGSTGPADDLETKIEGAVWRIYEANPMRADVLRLEYRAGFSELCERRSLYDLDFSAGQMACAHALGIGLRTYKRHLAAAREEIGQLLGLKP